MTSAEKPVVTGPAGWRRHATETLAAENKLYPELVAAGSLAAALERTAAELGIDLGSVVAADPDPRRWAAVVAKSPDRKAMGVGLGAVERWFLVSAWSRGVQLVSGSTQDLPDVVHAAAAWREGATLHEIDAAATFVKISEMAFAHERGAGDAVELQWRQLRQRAAAQDPEQLLPLVQAAAAEPRLRQLFPFTSHWTLLFSSRTGFPYSQDVPLVAPLPNNRYRVFAADRTTVVGDTDTADEAIALVIDGMPADVGPAIAGTAEDEPHGQP
jgi:hypothetical protein